MKTNSYSFDVIILGAGLSGCSMALQILSLLGAKNKLSIAMIEKKSYQNTPSESHFDDRCIALSAGSKTIFQTMGIWDELNSSSNKVVEEIKKIHISDRGHFGCSQISHQDYQLEALGYVVESRALGNCLLSRVKKEKSIRLFTPAKITQLDHQQDIVTVDLQQDAQQFQIKAGLLIAADGDNSFCHQFLDKPLHIKDYFQAAIIANVKMQYSHQGMAYERFTDSGPLALLPLTQSRSSLVWTAKEQDVDQILSYNDEQFKQALQQRFSYRLGKVLDVGKRFSYPLVLRRLDQQSVENLANICFVGNAAHTVHPVAGQGLNLGLRDVEALALAISDNIQQHQGKFDPNQAMLQAYWQQRSKDIYRVQTATDSLIRLFSNQYFPLTPLRNIGLLGLDLLPSLKHFLATYAMGR